MTGVSRKGCVLLAKQLHREAKQYDKRHLWGLALVSRISRDNWLKEARAK